MADDTPKPEQLVQIDYKPTKKGWMNPAVEFRKGTYIYSAVPQRL